LIFQGTTGFEYSLYDFRVPEGLITRHGATDEEDCVFLFISSVSGDIIFEDGPDLPENML